MTPIKYKSTRSIYDRYSSTPVVNRLTTAPSGRVETTINDLLKLSKMPEVIRNSSYKGNNIRSFYCLRNAVSGEIYSLNRSIHEINTSVIYHFVDSKE